MNPEKRPSREEQRDNPSAMWDHLGDRAKFRGHVAQQEKPQTYTMRITSGFSEPDSTTINSRKWELWFREKDKGANKDETYYHKVMQAIMVWNSIPQDERVTFLRTGQNSEKITEDLVSILTSGRIIDMREPSTIDIKKKKRKRENEDDQIRRKGKKRRPIWPFGGGRKSHKSSKGTSTGGEESESEEGYPIDGGEESESEEGYPIGGGEESESEEGYPIDGGEESESVEGYPINEGEGPDSEEGYPTENEETDDDLEIEQKKEEVYIVIRQIKKTELSTAEKDKIDEETKKQGKNFLEKLKLGALALLLSLTMIIPPIDTTIHPPTGEVTATTTETITTHHPGYEYQRHITEEEADQMRKELVEKLLQNTSLGDTVEAPHGLVLHNSSDYQYVIEQGGRDKTVTIGESPYRAEGTYTIDRVSFTDNEGKIIKAYHIEHGDSGSIQELLQKTREKYGYTGEIGIHIHLDGPDGGGELSGQTGWTESFGTEWVDENQVPETVTETVPGYDTESTITHEYTGQSLDISNGNIEIEGENGQKVTINVLNPDGTYRAPGEKIIGSDGNVYQIESLVTQEGSAEKKLNLLKLAHDIAMIAIAGTGIAITIARNRNGESENETDETNIEENGTAPTPEHKTEREMMELNGEQLIRLTKIFSEKAGDKAPQIAEELAKKAGIEISKKPVTEEETQTSAETEETIFNQMTNPETLVAQALLVLHDEATVRDLSEQIGMDLDEYTDQILHSTSKLKRESTASQQSTIKQEEA